MISKERLEEMEYYFWGETNDEDTQEWRDDLNNEEEKMVSEWDERVKKGISNLCGEIIKKIKKDY